MTEQLRADEVVQVGRRRGRVVSYRVTDRGQLCRIQFDTDGDPRPSDYPPGGEYVELFASSPRISRAAPVPEGNVA